MTNPAGDTTTRDRIAADAPAGGRCPSCGATYPRRIPVGEDQRCWTCATADQTGIEPAVTDLAEPESTRCPAVARDRRCHRRQGHDGRHRADEFPPLAWADGQTPERVGASRDQRGSVMGG